ncbi:MAG: hypothetical protein Q8742_02455 [Candidatus Phytoplasma australasiaticum]|nr:hypothetical protein [Candidatus Phytoplasma australasiaticum]
MIKNNKPLLLFKFIFILIGFFYSVNFYNLNAVGTHINAIINQKEELEQEKKRLITRLDNTLHANNLNAQERIMQLDNLQNDLHNIINEINHLNYLILSRHQYNMIRNNHNLN